MSLVCEELPEIIHPFDVAHESTRDVGVMHSIKDLYGLAVNILDLAFVACTRKFGCRIWCTDRRDVAYDKQKVLLGSATGHFSLLRALHMADYITELNGTMVFFVILISWLSTL
jgi:hypothetical protein